MTVTIANVAMLRGQGEEAKARSLFDALNHIQRSFGQAEYAYPEPLVMRDGLLTAEASLMTPAEFFRAATKGELPDRFEFGTDPETGNPRIAA